MDGGCVCTFAGESAPPPTGTASPSSPLSFFASFLRWFLLSLLKSGVSSGRLASLSRGRFLDVGAVVYQMSVCPWECPGFSVDACQEALFQMQAQVESLGFVPNLEHRFLIVAKNRK